MLSLLIRATGDDIGSRQKMQGSTVTTGKASSLFIATAEQLIPCSESDIWRTIVFNIPKGAVDLEALTWLQEHPDVLRFYSRLFVRFFSLNDDRVKTFYECFLSNRTSLRQYKSGLPDRLIANAAWLIAALWAISDFLEEIESVQPLTNDDRTTFLYWKDSHRTDCLTTIATQIARTPDKALAFYWPNDDSYVYLRTDTLMEAVGEYCRDHGNLDFTAPSGKTFRSMLVQNGLFVRQQHSKNRTKELSVNGTRYKVTVVFRDELEKWIGPMEQE